MNKTKNIDYNVETRFKKDFQKRIDSHKKKLQHIYCFEFNLLFVTINEWP